MAPETTAAAEPARDEPRLDLAGITLTALFLAFLEIALSSFGGALAWSRRSLVERRGWLTDREFAETLGLCQALPGPNVLNLAIMVGTRLHGTPGVVVAVAGLLVAPILVLLALGAAYSQFGQLEEVRTVLRGVGAVMAGLIWATGLRLAMAFRLEPGALLVGGLAWLGVGWLHLPLLGVLLVLAPLSVAAVWSRPR